MWLRLSLILLLTACRPSHSDFYSYLKTVPESCVTESPYFIVFLVNARHLNYTNCQCLLKTMAKHPSDASKNGDVGHAWIYLHSPNEIIEGGHSGELGIWQPKYWEGVMDNMELKSQNPVSYLWCSQCDGFFQKGSGGHCPTFAAKVNLTKAQFETLKEYVRHYPYHEYSLTKKQCSSFVKEVATLIGIELDDKVTLPINSSISLYGQPYQLWIDPSFSAISFSSPDYLEKSLYQLVLNGKAENVLSWYRRKLRRCVFCNLKQNFQIIKAFPERWQRYHAIQP